MYVDGQPVLGNAVNVSSNATTGLDTVDYYGCLKVTENGEKIKEIS